MSGKGATFAVRYPIRPYPLDTLVSFLIGIHIIVMENGVIGYLQIVRKGYNSTVGANPIVDPDFDAPLGS
jgi:hypothetical protein